jgi:hypothetical protein
VLTPLRPSPRRRAALLASAALLLVLGGSAVGGGTGPASAVTARAREGAFSGSIDADKRGGSTSTCNEVVTSGIGSGTITCSVEWSLYDNVRSICSVKKGQVAGEATYTSHENTPAPLSMPNIQLVGAEETGSGVFTGYFVTVTDPHVFHITIDASDACGATDLAALGGIYVGADAGAFTGHADYL